MAMLAAGIDFSHIVAPVPNVEAIAQEYAAIEHALAGGEVSAKLAAISSWDALRRRLSTWANLTSLRFQQDTANAEHRAAKELADELAPKLTELEVNLKRRLIADPRRAELESAIGAHAFRLWECDITTFHPALEQDLVRESKLVDEYTAIMAAAKIPFRGKTLNLAQIGKYLEAADRETRHEAERARWAFFGEHATQLDRIYAGLVELRHAMALKLGYENFIGLGYQLMRRVDYKQADVERYRDQVAEHVVPLAQKIIERVARDHGIERALFWDESVLDLAGNPEPLGGPDWIVEQARSAFSELAPELGDFFTRLCEQHLIDLDARTSKAQGGFCTSFPVYGWPFIFSNFNGTSGDIKVLVHETGHAFQSFRSRNLALADYLHPTYESCEIHSMGLEYLSLPQMERFFGPAAERYRRLHIADAMLFLPYGVAVDHFQHLVYAKPDATPQERHAMWQEVERRYLPWRAYGDLAHAAKGGLWQEKRHIYMAPFYYIDYTLALCCALQFWARSQDDNESALADYIALCDRGGAAPFQELVASANLKSPFAIGTLEGVLERVRATLNLV